MPHPPKHHHELIFKEDAVQQITEMLLELAEEESQVDSDTGEFLETTLAYLVTKRQKAVSFFINKFVEDILAYCHRKDFPLPLIFTVVEMLLKYFNDELSKNEVGTSAPLSEIKMDDTSFKFAVSSVDLSAIAGEQLFNSIKQKLNLYRKVVSL